ncbi:MAG: M56 family metallopeptidase [Acidimicrobiales bacterium]
MTIALLGASWLGLAGLVSPGGIRAITRLPARAQAAVLFVATLGLGAIPASIPSILLLGALEEGGGFTLRRCGRLIAAVLAQPLAQPRIGLALAVLVAGFVGICLGCVRAWRSQASSRRLAVAGNSPLVTVASPEPFAFTAGFLSPRVVVSSGLLGSAPAPWQRVVLAHEEAHRRGRHPLLVFVVESLARGLPLAPLRWAANSFRLALEFVADEHVLAEVGDREAVAEAIAGMALAPVAGVAFEGNEVRRCRRLLGPSARRTARLAGRVLFALLLGVLTLSGGHALHCAEASLHALAAIQCRHV